jgi:ABC-type bacteriocin/lantibiotic exporter with double-glycine peptidase domain
MCVRTPRIKKIIKMESINFAYQNTGEFVLKDINLTINKGERIGIVGSTGSGKSTFLDIFNLSMVVNSFA